MITEQEAKKLFSDANITNLTKYSEFMDYIFTIKYFSRTFSPDQVRNSFSSPILILPDLGPNKIYLIFYGTMGYKLDFQSIPYDCPKPGLIMSYGNANNFILGGIDEAELSASQKIIAQVTPAAIGVAPVYTLENKAIYLGPIPNDMTQGNSPVTIQFQYLIVDFS